MNSICDVIRCDRKCPGLEADSAGELRKCRSCERLRKSLVAAEWVVFDYSNGSNPATTRAVLEKYLVLYGTPDVPVRAATAREIADALAEDARIAALGRNE